MQGVTAGETANFQPTYQMNAEETKQAAEVMLAHANGKPVEYKLKCACNWNDLHGSPPTWNWAATEYREKTQPEPDIIIQGPADEVSKCWEKMSPEEQLRHRSEYLAGWGEWESNHDEGDGEISDWSAGSDGERIYRIRRLTPEETTALAKATWERMVATDDAAVRVDEQGQRWSYQIAWKDGTRTPAARNAPPAWASEANYELVLTPSDEHNPDNLTPEQYGRNDGWRLLTREEVERRAGWPNIKLCDEIEFWSRYGGGWQHGAYGNYLANTYRTKRTPEEFTAALEPKPEVKPWILKNCPVGAVVEVKESGEKHIISKATKGYVHTAGGIYTYAEILSACTMLDGSPCGSCGEEGK